MAIDVKRAVTFQKLPLVTQLKFRTRKTTDIKIFYFSSATRGHFWNATALYTSMDHWSKKF